MNRQMMGNKYPYMDPSMMGAAGPMRQPQYPPQQPDFQIPMMKQQQMRPMPMMGNQMPPYFQQPIHGQPMYQPAQQMPAQQIIITRPNPAKEKYAWQPRTEPMKWQLAESIDVDQIVRKGDLNSVEFYMEQFAFANIQKDDMKQFGSKGALNAFLILQLGCDYLMAQRDQAPPPSTSEPDQKLLEQYNQNIKAASESIMQHKSMIKKLQAQIAQLKDDREREKTVIGNYRRKMKIMKEELRNRRTSRRSTSKGITDTEPGALHDETALRALRQADIERKKLDKTDDLSDGAISDSETIDFGTTKSESSDDDQDDDGYDYSYRDSGEVYSDDDYDSDNI